ncbi:MAG: hypothetical protein WA280_02385, partial [Xanthobacteraceae bacterium]
MQRIESGKVNEVTGGGNRLGASSYSHIDLVIAEKWTFLSGPRPFHRPWTVTLVTITAAGQLIWHENRVICVHNSFKCIERDIGRDVETHMGPRWIGLTAGTFLAACALLPNFACA